MSVILVVDDNDEIREIFTIGLSIKGHTVHSAAGGRECLEMLNSLIPDLILLDILMPDIDGWEALCAIKQNPTTQTIPVTMCSGKLPDLEEIDRYGHYIEDYLVKPQELSTLPYTLTGIIHRYINHRSDMAILKDDNSHHLLIDEFYDRRKKLYLLKKFSRFFTTDLQKIESAIDSHKTRMSEIRNSLNHPILSGELELQQEIPCMQKDAVFPLETDRGKSRVVADNLTMGWRDHEDPGGLRYER